MQLYSEDMSITSKELLTATVLSDIVPKMTNTGLINCSITG